MIFTGVGEVRIALSRDMKSLKFFWRSNFLCSVMSTVGFGAGMKLGFGDEIMGRLVDGSEGRVENDPSLGPIEGWGLV